LVNMPLEGNRRIMHLSCRILQRMTHIIEHQTLSATGKEAGT
jgi:hypothetical protein